MTPSELREMYRTFTHEAVRVESLQHYVVPGDEERQQAFREGRPLPERPGKKATLELIANAAATGRRMWRLHVVDQPLSEYVRYELEAAYPENVTAGEGVWIADRSSHSALDAIRRDFVLFDPDTDHGSVVWYDYTPEGQLIGYTQGTPDDVRVCSQQLATARAHAVPLAEFLNTCKEMH